MQHRFYIFTGHCSFISISLKLKVSFFWVDHKGSICFQDLSQLGGSRRKPEVNIVSLHAVSFLIKTKRDNLTQLCSHLFTPSVTGSRENMIYSADCLRDDLYVALLLFFFFFTYYAQFTKMFSKLQLLICV